jgi:multidrug efflux pump subunit AcrA (membrane-fusion protein)
VTRRRWMIIGLVVLGMLGMIVVTRMRPGAGGMQQQAQPAQPEIPVEVAPVTRETLEATVQVSGTLTSARLARIFPRRSGRVTRVLVSEGAYVRAGQVLVMLDRTEAEVRVRQAAATVRAAEAQLALLRAGARPEEVAQARDAVLQAESALASARSQVLHAMNTLQTMETNLNRMEALFKEGAVAQSQVDQARWEVDRARAQLIAAQSQVRAAEAQLNSARQRLALVQKGARPEEIRAAQAQLEQARAVLAEAQQVAEDLTIRAPFAGRVARLRLSQGDFVSAGEFGTSPVAIIYDDSALEAEVTVGEREAGLVRPGQPAMLRAEVARGAQLSATVKTISPLAEPGSRAVTIRLRLSDTLGRALLPGTFVRGDIIVDRRENVLTVPREALENGAQPTVRVVMGNVVRSRRVQVGVSQDERVEVTGDIREGELVVTLGPEDLPDGAKVIITRQVNR